MGFLENQQIDMSDYIFVRGRDRDSGNREGSGEIHGGVSGSKDSDGNDRMSADVGGSYGRDNWSIGGSAGVSGGRDNEGNVNSEVHGEIHGQYNF